MSIELTELVDAIDDIAKRGNFATLWPHEIRLLVSALRSSQSTSDAGGGVRVKPLEWDEVLASRSDEDPTPEHAGDYEAASPVGTYYIEMYFGSDSYGWQVRHDDEIIADKDDPDNAKAAAQTHYEQRILSALSNPAADSNASANDWLPDGKKPMCASAEARLREALDALESAFRSDATYSPLLEGRARRTRKRREKANLVIETVFRIRQELEALSPDPHASDCEQQGETIIGGTALCGHGVMAAICDVCNRPSDRTADVTKEELRTFLLENSEIFQDEGVAALATLSPQAGDRRDAIARIIDPHAFIIVNPKRVDMMDRQRWAREKADQILAGLVQDEAETRADEREKCAKICNERGIREQEGYGLTRGAQNYFRAAAAIRSARDGGAEG